MGKAEGGEQLSSPSTVEQLRERRPVAAAAGVRAGEKQTWDANMSETDGCVSFGEI